MFDPVILAAFGAALFMSWIIGATGASPSFGPVSSAGAASIFRGSLITGIAAFAGASLQGGAVAETMRSGIVTGVELGPVLASLILVTASLLMVFSIITQYPMPTVFTVVGGVMGVGLAAGGALNVPKLQIIGFFWAIIPFAAIAIGYSTAIVLRKYVPKNERSSKAINTILFVVATYTAFTAGANQAGLAVGPLQNLVQFDIGYLLLFSGAGMLIGAWTGSPRMIEAVARDYTRMGPRRAIAALVAASVIAQIGTFLGVPVSFNEAIISAIIGSGLVEGKAGVSKRKIGWTVAGWIGAFIVATSVTYGLTLLTLQVL